MEIVAVRHGSTGKIESYKLDSGKVIKPEKAISLVESGKLPGYNVSTARNGVKAIRSNRDGTEEGNLGNLPSF